MFKSLAWKLTLGFMLVAFTTAVLVAVFIRVTSVNRLTALVVEQQRKSLQGILSEYYAARGSWDDIDENWGQIQSQVLSGVVSQVGSPSNEGEPHVETHEDEPHSEVNPVGYMFGLADEGGRVIVPVDPKYPPGSSLPEQFIQSGTPVNVGAQRVGTILIANRPPELNTEEALYLQRTNQALVLAALGALLVAMVVGILLARTLTHPLKALTQATHRISEGDVEQQVQVNSQDEIGELAKAFNRMSQEVMRVNQSRRQMTADIAHDLRTPLTVISGYVESMKEGVVQPTTERFSLIETEIERLQTLVGDLRMLSLADAGELPFDPQPVSPEHLLDQAAALFQHQAEQQQVVISVQKDGSLPTIQVDETRMMQVMENLLSNALRYTPAGGEIILSAQEVDGNVDLIVRDTGEGIPPEDLPYIFDRFHRADKSRNTEVGESGLGLAIVKAFVKLHGGSVWAESTLGQGATFHLLFPV